VPPRPGRHLDLYLVLRDLPEDPSALVRRWRAERLDEPSVAGEIVEGGYRGTRLDLPGQETLYANRQGGFQVLCPACDTNLVPGFGPAMSAWRAGREDPLACTACRWRGHLHDATYRPPAAFGRAAWVLVDAGSLTISPLGLQRLTQLFGSFAIVGSRR
jgi:hypothetical protein